jgi:hypothetical protein
MDVFFSFIQGVEVGFEFVDTSSTFLVNTDAEDWSEGFYNPGTILRVDLFIVRIVFVW